MAILVYGVGVVGMKKIHTRRNGVVTVDPIYKSWSRMLERGYTERYKVRPTYKDVTVCEEWHFFPTFRKWALSNGFDPSLELDKDMLVKGNKIYSPGTCAYIPKWLNQSLSSQQAKRGEWPMGVSYRAPRKNSRKELNKPYLVYIKVDSRNDYAGSFSDPMEAHAHWQLLKADQIERTILKYMFEPFYQQSVANAMYQRAEILRSDAEQGLESFIF